MDARFDIDALRPDLGAVDLKCAILQNLPLDPLFREWLKRRAWVRTVRGTTRIEGNTLSDLEVEQLLDNRASRSLPRKDALEVLGTRAALTFVDEIARDEGIPIDQAAMREIHRRVLQGQGALLTPGEYRRGENRVGGSDGDIIFTTPPSGDVPVLMRALSDWLGGDMSTAAPIRAAVAHLEFVAIHPFNNGNGRTARALSRLLLMRGGYAVDGLVSLDAWLDLRRRDYFAAIRASIGQAYEPGYDATPFVSFFLRAIAGAADHVLARLRGLGQVQIRVRRDVAEGRLAPMMLDGLVYAWINRSLRPADYQRVTGRGPAPASRDLAKAERLGYIIGDGAASARWYRLGPKLLEAPAEDETTDLRAFERR